MKKVWVNGCFDILHRGHIDILEKAKKLGDILIVAVNSDNSVKKIKGDSRPINDLDSRLSVLSGLKCINFLISFESRTPLELYKTILPDVLVKGGDCSAEDVVGGNEVISSGGSVKVLNLLEGYSTTAVIEKIRQ